MSIRQARLTDAHEIRSMIFDSVTPHRYSDFNEEGWNSFVKPNEIEAVEKRIASKNYLTLCYELEGKIVGIITIYQDEKIDQLFVHPDHRRIRVASKLWYAARKLSEANGNRKRYWVKSSTLAVPLYQTLGFCLTGGKKTKNGITYYPMELASDVES